MDDNSQKDKNSESETKSLDGNSIVIKDNDVLSFFKKDKSFVFAHKKIGKLVSALYLITNQLNDNEPIKWDIRRIGLKLISLNINLIKETISIEVLKKDIKESVLEVVSCLEVASVSGLLSSMNLNILKKEFFELLNHLNQIKSRSGHIDSKFYYVEYENQDSPLKRTEIKDINLSSPYDPALNNRNTKDNEDRDTKLKEFSTVTVKKNRRQSIIIALLKKKRDLMIKDISPLISDCSEKTIQRELQDLVKQGVLKKTGEKRWTKYSLI